MITCRAILSAIAAVAFCLRHRPIRRWRSPIRRGPCGSSCRLHPAASTSLRVSLPIASARYSGSPLSSKTVPAAPAARSAPRQWRVAEPDGYTLLFSTPGPVRSAPLVNRNVDYDSRNFSPVAIVSNSPLMLVINPALPVNTVQELIAYAKANPGKVHFSSPGYGTQPHLLGEMLKCRPGPPSCTFPTVARRRR